MAFLSDIFGRVGRVARGQANSGVDALEDATFEATVKQTVTDMKNELNNVVRSSAVAMSNYNSLDPSTRSMSARRRNGRPRGVALDAGNEDCPQGAGQEAECDSQVASCRPPSNRRTPPATSSSSRSPSSAQDEEGERTATTW